MLDDELAQALKGLPERERDIVLMYFFLGMSDTEIGKEFNIDRTSSYRSRRKSLDTIRKKLKEKTQNE
ncbi:sigma-70, region 4 family protein [Clostridioides difficile P50]|nr:sigma-70, region 4 family protein [Clostridioides difficile DA00196]EQI53363.1 sigma-70, region 4 family protein [Clostridioides difficile Y270]EQJ94509.1 sigma-70, region 4 family protein [Clostridioides difficile P50]